MKKINKTPAVKIQELIDQMTLTEKIGQLVLVDKSWDQDIPSLIREGRIGSLLTIRNPEEINEFQKIAVDESRLGIPLLFGNDVIHGYKTILPIPLAQACSWNLDLIHEAEVMVAKEALAAGTQWNYSPMVDVTRDPRWGRVAEGSGEDTFLTSQIAKTRIEAYQRENLHPFWRMAACVKHFAGYGAPIGGKDYNSVTMSEEHLRQVHLPPFKAAIDAGAASIMTAFHDLNGIPATINKLLLKKILRDEWGFSKVITSDFDSIGELIHHRVAKDHYEAAKLAALAGVDIDMMGNAYHYHLEELVDEGIVPEQWIDDAVIRILELKEFTGILEAPYIDLSATQTTFSTPDNLQIAANLALESIVLLKNEKDILPLSSDLKNIALIGPFIDERDALLGCWRCEGNPDQVETIFEVLSKALPDKKIKHARGCDIEGTEVEISKIEQVLDVADACVMLVGESAEMSGEAHSRAYLGLPGAQAELIKIVHQARIPLILVIISGRPLAIPLEIGAADAVLLAMHGGTKAGEAIAQTIVGKNNPSGKLPISLPVSEGQIPVYYAHNSTGRPIDSNGTIQFNQEHKSKYLDIPNAPLFPFGFGLSYSKFEYSNFKCNHSKIKNGDTVKLEISVTNIGNCSGKDIIQLYIQDEIASKAVPIKELKGFAKISLEPGETKDVVFWIETSRLGYFDETMDYTVEPGVFNIYIGSDSKAPCLGFIEIIQ